MIKFRIAAQNHHDDRTFQGPSTDPQITHADRLPKGVVTPSHPAFPGPIKSLISLSHFFVSGEASMEVISQVYTHSVLVSK
jgi:hypothetical protein